MGRSRKRNRHREALKSGVTLEHSRKAGISVTEEVSIVQGSLVTVASRGGASRVGEVTVLSLLPGSLRHASHEELTRAVIGEVARHYGLAKNEVGLEFVLTGPVMLDATSLVMASSPFWPVSIRRGITTVAKLIEMLEDR